MACTCLYRRGADKKYSVRLVILNKDGSVRRVFSADEFCFLRQYIRLIFIVFHDDLFKRASVMTMTQKTG